MGAAGAGQFAHSSNVANKSRQALATAKSERRCGGCSYNRRVSWWLKRRGASAVLALGLGSVGCQDGYPIAPTLCDEWCEETRHVSCFNEDPAACVASCEKSGLTRGACRALTAETVQCLRENPEPTLDCQTQYTALGPCAETQEAAIECGSSSFTGNPPQE